MKIVKGTFNEAKVFTDNVDYACLDQLKNLLNCKAFEGEKIRIMPDCHAGAGCVVGYTQTITTGKVVSNLVGVDIGCGMSYVKIPKVDLRQLDKVIHQFIPAGFEIHKPGELPNRLVNGVIDLMDKLYAPLDETRRARIMNSIGTLGGGNHFLELDTCVETGDTYLVVHTGSRNLGLQVAKYWQSVAEKEMKNHSVDINAIVKRLKSEGRETEIESEIKKIIHRSTTTTQKIEMDIKVGEKVRIISGPFAEFVGDIMEVYPDKAKLRAMVSIFGRETPVELEYKQIQKL
jgi:RNA-splicing ligase RtcB